MAAKNETVDWNLKFRYHMFKIVIVICLENV